MNEKLLVGAMQSQQTTIDMLVTRVIELGLRLAALEAAQAESCNQTEAPAPWWNAGGAVPIMASGDGWEFTAKVSNFVAAPVKYAFAINGYLTEAQIAQVVAIYENKPDQQTAEYTEPVNEKSVLRCSYCGRESYFWKCRVCGHDDTPPEIKVKKYTAPVNEGPICPDHSRPMARCECRNESEKA